MAQATTLILLPQLAYNSTSVVNNGYTGDKQQAASFYMGNHDLQTITWSLTGVSGLISIQATLAENPGASDWFTVYNISCNNTTQNSFTNLSGNFVYLRVVVSNFSIGTIQSVKVSY